MQGDKVNLQDRIVRYNALGRSVLGGYQPSGMSIQKWQLLKHLENVIEVVEGILFTHIYLYEGFYNMLKSVYPNGFHQLRYAMDESVSRYYEKRQNGYLFSINETWDLSRSVRSNAISHDSEMMARSVVTTTLVNLESLLLLLSHQRETTEIRGSKINMWHNDLLKIGQYCLLPLCRLLVEQRWQLYKAAATARQMKMMFPASAYISRITATAPESTDDVDAETLKGSDLKLLQRLVAGD